MVAYVTSPCCSSGGRFECLFMELSITYLFCWRDSSRDNMLSWVKAYWIHVNVFESLFLTIWRNVVPSRQMRLMRGLVRDEEPSSLYGWRVILGNEFVKPWGVRYSRSCKHGERSYAWIIFEVDQLCSTWNCEIWVFSPVSGITWIYYRPIRISIFLRLLSGSLMAFILNPSKIFQDPFCCYLDHCITTVCVLASSVWCLV